MLCQFTVKISKAFGMKLPWIFKQQRFLSIQIICSLGKRGSSFTGFRNLWSQWRRKV